jgi:hypothetical protein
MIDWIFLQVQVIKMPNAKDDAQFLSPEKNILPLPEPSPHNCERDLVMSVLNSSGKVSGMNYVMFFFIVLK